METLLNGTVMKLAPLCHGSDFGAGAPETLNERSVMTEHDEMFEVVEVPEPAVVAMSMSMSFVAVDEDAE